MAGHPPGDHPPKTDRDSGDWLLKLVATLAAGLPAYYFADDAIRGLALHALLSLGFCVYTHFMDAATGIEQAVLAVIVVIMALGIGRAIQKINDAQQDAAPSRSELGLKPLAFSHRNSADQRSPNDPNRYTTKISNTCTISTTAPTTRYARPGPRLRKPTELTARNRKPNSIPQV